MRLLLLTGSFFLILAVVNGNVSNDDSASFAIDKSTRTCDGATVQCASNERCEFKKVDDDCLENCAMETVCVKNVQHKITCKENEKVYRCGSACEPSCQIPESMGCTKQCLVNVCQCIQGFYRDYETGKCVKRDECNSTKINIFDELKPVVNESEIDLIREEMCIQQCGAVKNCWIHSFLNNESLISYQAICAQESSNKEESGVFIVETVTPTPGIDTVEQQLDEEKSTKPNILCSIRCPEGKRCEIVDLPCLNLPCSEIDVCVDDK